MNFLPRLLDILSPAVLNPLDQLWRGDRSSSFVKEVERVLALPMDSVREYQLARLREVADHAGRHTRFYARRFAEAGIAHPGEMTWSDLSRFPFLTREDMRSRGEELASDAFAAVRVRSVRDGGTLSSPVPFLLDKGSSWRRWAAMQAFDRRLGYRPGLRVGYLWGARQDWPASPSLKQRLRIRAGDPFAFLPIRPARR